MTWDITDRFPNWGETGESPPTGFFYEGGDQVNEKHLDYLWNSVKGLEDDVQSALNDIDNDGDGTVDLADDVVTDYSEEGHDHTEASETQIPDSGLVEDYVTSAESSTYTDSDAVNAVDAEVDNTANSVAGLDNLVAAHEQELNNIDSDGDGTVDIANTAIDATNVTATYKGNDIDSDGDGIVDGADTALGLTNVNFNELSNIYKVKSGTVTVSSGTNVKVLSNYSTNTTNSVLFCDIVRSPSTNSTSLGSMYGFGNTDPAFAVNGQPFGYSITESNSEYSIFVGNADSSSHDINYVVYEIEP
jgi:hypothetical protein